MNKYYIDVKTIKYLDNEIPAIVLIDKKAYIISEIKSVNHRAVFPKGGTGSIWIAIINGKETTLCHDKHNLHWHIYRKAGNERELTERTGERLPAGSMLDWK